MDSEDDMLDAESIDEDFYSGVDSDADADDDYELGDNNSDDSDDMLSNRNQMRKRSADLLACWTDPSLRPHIQAKIRKYRNTFS